MFVCESSLCHSSNEAEAHLKLDPDVENASDEGSFFVSGDRSTAADRISLY